MPGNVIELTLVNARSATARPVVIDELVIAGWTGRDRAAVEKHIVELEALGVQRPSRTPVFYRVSASRLTTAESVESHTGSNVRSLHNRSISARGLPRKPWPWKALRTIVRRPARAVTYGRAHETALGSSQREGTTRAM